VIDEIVQDRQRHRDRNIARAGAQRGYCRRHFIGRGDRRRPANRQKAGKRRQDHPGNRAVIFGALSVDRAV